jgi:hypothetical protein
MAILADGRVLREGAPRDLVAGLAGRVWRRTVEKREVDGYRASLAVLSTQLFEGKTLLHVVADERPEPGFDPVEPGLEDVYFSVLAAREG